jgi:hypothetical protein
VALHRLLVRASREAEALGHERIGLDHFVLALLLPADVSAAAQALRDCGLTHEAYAEQVGRGSARGGGREPTAAAYQMMGRAEGLAAGLGAAQPAPEHVLLAILWDTGTEFHLGRLGVTRQDVVRRLRETAVALPTVALPVPEERRWGERVTVPIGQLRALRAELPDLLPPGATFGFNHDGAETGWLIATEDVDLPAYIAAGLAAWERGRLPCPCCRYVTLDRHQPRSERRCEVCWWSEALDPLRDGAGLAEASRTFVRLGVCDERFRDQVRPPRPDEAPPWRTGTPPDRPSTP